MAKELQVTCKFCKTKIDKSSAISDGDRRYFCSEECRQHQVNKDTYKAKKVKSDGEPNDRRKLTDYMLEIFLANGYERHQINWELQTAQLKNIMSDHKDWTYAQIQYVLKYMYEISEVNLFSSESNGSILSLVPFYFIEARDFAIKSRDIKQAVKEFDFDYTPNIIERDLSINRMYKKKKKEIDMNTILD